jgi:hypothetical protein
MEHLLYDHEIPALPTFLEIWAKHGENTDEIVRQQCLKKQRPLDDVVDIDDARKGPSWNVIETYEERFCTHPQITIHLFTGGRILWRPVDLNPDEPNPNEEYGESYRTFKEVAEYLIHINKFTKEQLFPKSPNRPETARPDPARFSSFSQPIFDDNSEPSPNGQHTSSTQSHNGHAPDPPRPENREAEFQHVDPMESRFPPDEASTSTTNQTPPSRPTTGLPTAGVYPLDLLLALRRAYAARQSEDLNSFQTAVGLVRNHPSEHIEKTTTYTLFHQFDPKHPNASLKATYHPNLRWSIELQTNNHAPTPLPTQFAQAIHLQPLLANWKAFKEHLPFYEGRLFPPGHPGSAENGFLLLHKDLDPLFTLESARTLNQFLDRNSPAQHNLIRICLIQASLQNRQHAVPGPDMLPVPVSPLQQPTPYYQSEGAKLHAFAYALSLNTHPDPERAIQTYPLRIQEALALLAINATELTAPGSPAQQALYRNITQTFNQRHPPLTDQSRAAIAHHFPQTCQNAELIDCTIKKQGILPSDPTTRYNLVIYACENADAELLGQLLRLSDNQGEPVRLKRGDPEKFSKWILAKSYPDQQSAKRCLEHLPLSPLLRLSLDAQFKKPGWKRASSSPPPPPSPSTRVSVNI